MEHTVKRLDITHVKHHNCSNLSVQFTTYMMIIYIAEHFVKDKNQ